LRRRVTRAAKGATFTVGFMPGLIVTQAVRRMRESHPGLTVDVVRLGFDDQTDAIHDGRIDVGYVRLPIDARGLKVAPLLSEPRVAVVPAEHRLAGKDSISIGDLADEHLLQNPDAVPEWRGIAAGRLPALRSVEEKLEHVAAGRGVVVLPLSTATFYIRPDVTHVAIDDIGPSQVCLAWESSRRSRLVQDFAAIAADTQ